MLKEVYTNSRRHTVRANTFCSVASHICGYFVWDFRHIASLAKIIASWLTSLRKRLLPSVTHQNLNDTCASLILLSFLIVSG